MDGARTRGRLKPEYGDGASEGRRNRPFNEGNRESRYGNGYGSAAVPPPGSGREARSSRSPEPSFVQPTILSESHDNGSYRLGGSEPGSPPPPSFLPTPGADSGSEGHHMRSISGEIEHLASMFKMKPKRNNAWKPNGPMDVCIWSIVGVSV
jgi:hypothetical protein